MISIGMDKIYKHELGTRYRLTTRLDFDFPVRGKANYRQTATYCLPKKRTWHSLTNSNDYKYRSLSMDDRRKKEISDIRLTFGEDFIHKAKLELWNSIKPLINNEQGEQ